MKKFQIILYYNYVDVDNPDELRSSQLNLCTRLGIKGRIIVSHEGINGTLEGTTAAVETYMNIMKSDKDFVDTHFKTSPGKGDAFPKLSVKVRSELVSAHLGDQDVNPNKVTGKYITADQLYMWLESGKEFYIVDMRNDYEQKVGYFDRSILAPLGNFRDLPSALPSLETLKHKTIVTVCTGGVRCEKASGYLLNNGFNDVYQLFGGIQTFMERYPNRYFMGKLYVFDGRITWAPKPNSKDHVIVSRCEICGVVSDKYVDCRFVECERNRHFISCDGCIDENGFAFCSKECRREAYRSNKIFSKFNDKMVLAKP